MEHRDRRRTSRRFETHVWLALVLAIGCSDGSGPSARNVLLITIDTLRADALGAYGSSTGASPHFDRLAQRGVLFEQANSPCPNTLPSHATILTGLYPHRHGVRENGIEKLADPIVTLAERLRDAGYATGAEVASIVLNRPTGIAQGFKHFVDMDSPGIARNQITVGQDGSLHDPSAVSSDERTLKTVYVDSRGAGEVSRGGIAFLREHRDEPFFLWLHYYDPHWPFAPPAPFEARFAANQYAGEVAYTDEKVANVIDELERLGLDDRTLVVVTADHGEGLGEHGESHHTYYLYQTTIHVPLAIVGPQVTAGRRVATPVSLVDIAPTILAWAGQAPNGATDGISLLPALTGGEVPSRPVYGDSVTLSRMVHVSPVRFLREDRWKLIHKPIPELYDLNADPAELRNLADREDARVERMREQMRALISVRPEVAAAPHRELDAKTRQQLASLGYVVGDPGQSDGDTMDVYGADPTTIATRFEPFIHALEASQFVDVQETADVVERFSQEFPASSRLLSMMLDVQLAAGRAEQALKTLRRGIEIDPDNKGYWTRLGELLMRLGRHAEAKKALVETLRRWPCELTSRTQLANVYAQLGARADQIAVLEQGVEQCSAPPELMNDLAYQLATAREAKLRNGPRALELAEKMIGSLGDNPLALDTLAVAQAEVGRREDARSTLSRALDLARRQKLPAEGLRVLEDHAAKIEAGESIRE